MGNNSSRLDSHSIDLHNKDHANKIKIFLFGTNAGKSDWFHGTKDHQPLVGITFKTESYSIGDKLPDIETIVYDTAENMDFVDDHLQYLTSADGIILTYNIFNIESLQHLKKSIDKIIQNTFFGSKHTRVLLLGMKEIKEEKNPLHQEHRGCMEAASLFAKKWNLFHKQIDITKNIKTIEPYVYLLRLCLKQKKSKITNSNKSGDQKEDLGSEDSDEEEEEEDTLLLVHDIMGDFIYPEADLYQNGKQNFEDLDYGSIENMDTECQLEFERFLRETLGQKRCNKYLNRFKLTKSNDIRFIDPDIFDDHLLENDDIKMDILDKKLFKKEIEKYKQQSIAFEHVLSELNMKQKYLICFVNRGIATLWSYHYHIKVPMDLDKIINNHNDAEIIWDAFTNKNEQNSKKNDKISHVSLQKYKSYAPESNVKYEMLKNGAPHNGYMSDPNLLNHQNEGDDDSEHSNSDLMYNQTGQDETSKGDDGWHATKGQFIKEFNANLAT